MSIRAIVYLAITACLLGCVQSPKPLGKPLPELTYGHLISYSIQGGAVEIRQSFQPDKEMLKIAREFPMTPGVLLNRYARSRFITAEVPFKMVFDIARASLAKKPLKENMIGILTGAATEVYVLDVFITMSLFQPDGSLSSPYTISLKRELLIPDRASLAENEFRKFEFLEQALTDIDLAVTNIITKKLQ